MIKINNAIDAGSLLYADIIRMVDLKYLIISYSKVLLHVCKSIYAHDNDRNKRLLDSVFTKFTMEEIETRVGTLVKKSHFIRMEEVYEYQLLAEFIGNMTNTVLFRTFKNKKGRTICFLNPHIGSYNLASIRATHAVIDRWLVSCISTASGDLDKSTYNRRDKRNLYIGAFNTEANDNFANEQLNTFLLRLRKDEHAALAKMDISKFYDSITSNKFLKYHTAKTVSMLPREGWDEYDFDGIVRIDPDVLVYSTPRSLCNILKADGVINNSTDYLLTKEFDSRKNTFEHRAPEDYDLNKICRVNNVLANYFIGAIYYNRRIPTGAIYSLSLANLYIAMADLELENYLHEHNFVGFRYVDDLTIGLASNNNFNGFSSISSERKIQPVKIGFKHIKDIEAIYNKYGLHLNYSKTCIQRNGNGRFSLLGKTYSRLNNESFSSAEFINSKYRKIVLDLTKDKPNIKDPSVMGKLRYAYQCRGSVLDLALHYDFNRKAAMFEKLKTSGVSLLIDGEHYNVRLDNLNISYKDFIHRIRVADELDNDTHYLLGAESCKNLLMRKRVKFATLIIGQFFVKNDVVRTSKSTFGAKFTPKIKSQRGEDCRACGFQILIRDHWVLVWFFLIDDFVKNLVITKVSKNA